jgi:hypothetical protein
MPIRNFVAAALTSTAIGLACQGASANLVSLGPVSLSGLGVGSLNTVLTLQSPGTTTTESGCVSAGVGGALVTGPTACSGGHTGGNETGLNATFSAAPLGLTDMANLRIVFNASEPDSSITLDELSVSFWDPATGSILDAKNTAGPVTFANTDPGAGNVGFGFALDASQAAISNFVLAAFPNLFIGISADLSGASGGPETFAIGVAGAASTVPEPGVNLLLGIGALGLVMLRKRFVR